MVGGPVPGPGLGPVSPLSACCLVTAQVQVAAGAAQLSWQYAGEPGTYREYLDGPAYSLGYLDGHVVVI